MVYHDGSPVTDERNFVRVKRFYSYDDEEFTESKHKLSAEGIVELTYDPPLENVTVLRIEVRLFFHTSVNEINKTERKC